MPVLVYDNGMVSAERTILCRSCKATLRLSLQTEGRPEVDAREHILVTMDGAIWASATVLGWRNVDDLNRADCPRHRATTAAVLPVRDLSDPIVPAMCEGDHFFENRCNACGASQPDGPCEVCPHIGPQGVCSAEHFARRPCRACKSANMRTVRVRAAVR